MTYSYLSLPNIPYVYGNILPGGWANFSGETHVFTVDPNMLQFNGGLGLNQLALGMLNNFGTTNYSIPGLQSPLPNIDTYVQGITNPIINQQASSNINSCMAAIKATRDKLNAMLLQEGITDAQKEEINKLLKELEEQENQLSELTKSQDKYTPQEALNKSREIQNAIRETATKAAKIGQPSTPTSTDTSTSTSTSTDTSTSTSTDTSTSTSTSTDTETQGAAGRTGNFSNAAIELVDAFHDATYCTGTDDETFEAVCSSINKDNVMEVMRCWQELHGAEKDESFMEAFMWDADRSQKITYGKQIARALRAKAMELGIMDECREDFAKISKEMGSWLWVDNDVYQNYDNIIQKIAEKEGHTYTA